MTTPPGGPYGQDPSGANPYGPGPAWTGQPPPGGYPQPPGGPGYPPGGWPGGPSPYGPPPKKPRSKLPWLIGAGIAVLIAVALVVTLVLTRGDDSDSAQTTPSATASYPSSAATPAPETSAQSATGCTSNVSPGGPPRGDSISAGALSFPAGAAPGWMAFGDQATPNAIDAIGVQQQVPDASQWVMQAVVGITNFVTSMDIETQASTLMGCVVDGPGFIDAEPTLGPTTTSSIQVDGTDAARVDADITIGDTSRGIAGDSVTIIAVQTTPVTFFLGDIPIGDADARATMDGIIAALRVTND